MKKKFLLIISILLIIITTGCAQVTQTITVNKDKSVDLVIIEAIDTTKFTQDEINSIKNELNLNKLENSGYEIEGRYGQTDVGIGLPSDHYGHYLQDVLRFHP